MTVPCMSFNELVEKHLTPNGYIIVTPQPEDFWEEHDRIMVKKDDYTFPLQYQKKYFYLQIVHLFQQLEIQVPEDHQRNYDQQMAYNKQHKLVEESKQETDKSSETDS